MSNKEDEYIIFGASDYGTIAFNTLKNKYNIVAFADNNIERQKQDMYGLRIISAKEVYENKYKVIIASHAYNDIGKQLINLGCQYVEVFFFTGEWNLKIYDSKDYILIKYSPELFFKNLKLYNQKNLFNIAKSEKRKVNNFRGKKYVLFCAYYFPPLGLGGTQRSLKYVKYLRKFGYEPIVVTVGNDKFGYKHDYSLLKELPSDIKIIRIDNNYVSAIALSEKEQQDIFDLFNIIEVDDKWKRKYIEMVSDKSIKSYEEALFNDGMLFWVKNVIDKIDNLIDVEDIDVVYTTGNPFSSNIIGYYLKKKYGIPWVSDYRDSWTADKYIAQKRYHYTDVMYVLQYEVEKRIVNFATHIITVDENIKKQIISNFNIASEKITTITNGYDEEDFTELLLKDNNKFILCYNGQIYKKDDRFSDEKNYLIIIKAINNLIRKKYIMDDNIEWTISGEIDNSVKADLKRLDEYNVIKFNGYLEHKKSLQLAYNANILIHFGFYCGANLYGSGGAKVYEYMRLQKPLLFLSEKNGNLDKLASYLGYAENFDYADICGIENYILKNYISWKKNENIKFDIDKIRIFERENLTQNLSIIFNKCI